MPSRKKVLITIIFISLSLYSICQITSKLKESFIPDEKLNYSIRYGFIEGGVVEATVRYSKYNNKTVFYSKTIARSVGLVDLMYKVYDIHESYFDIATGMPYKAIRNVSEGSYTYFNEVSYNRDDSTIHCSRKDTIKKTPPEIMDVVSAFYYLRRLDFSNMKPGDKVELVIYFGNDIVWFPIRFVDREIIRTNFGKIRCLRFDPVVEPGRVFTSEDDLRIWFTDDPNHIPILAEMGLVVGSVKIELTEYSNLKKPLSPIK